MRRNLGFALVVLLAGDERDRAAGDPREAPGTHPAPAAGGAQAEPGATSPQEGPVAEKSTPDAGADASDGGQSSSSRFLPTFSADAATHERAKHLMGVYAEYEPRSVLVTFAEDTSADEANALLAQAKAVVPAEVTQADLDYGLVTLSVADGLVVEDAVVELAGAPEVDVVQPNYVYRINDESRAGATSLASRLAQANPAHHFARPAATTSPADELLRDASDEQEVAIDDFDGYSSSQRAARTWHLTDVNAFKAWSYLADASGVPSNNARVAIFDDGFDVTNEDIAPNYDSRFAYNTADNNTQIGEISGHGTHVAGISAARANNGKLAAGVSYNAPLALLKVFSDDGYASSSALYSAYTRVSDYNRQGANIRVVNMSLGASQHYVDEDGEVATIGDVDPLTNMDALDTTLYRRMKSAFDAGIVTVCAAGNARPNEEAVDEDGTVFTYVQQPPYANYPSDMSVAVAVINLQQGGKRYYTTYYGADFGSNFNYPGTRAKNISAPGTSIYSTYGTTTASLSGTSMASPVVAGVFSMIFAEKSELSASEARAIAYSCAKDLQYDDSRGYAGPGWDEQTGYGEIDALAIMRNLNPEVTGPDVLRAGETGTCLLSCGNPNASVSWASSDPSVVSVTPGGGMSATLTGGSRGVATITATFTDSNAEGDTYSGSASIQVASNSIAHASVTAPDQTYTGSALAPVPTVRVDSDELAYGVDFRVVSYGNNVNAGEATVTVEGIGAWSGQATGTFTVSRALISAATITCAPATYDCAHGYTATTATLTYNGRTLVSPADFAYGTFSGNTGVGPGAGTLTVVGYGNFFGSATAPFDIAPFDVTNCSETTPIPLVVTLENKGGAHPGADPTPTVTLGSRTLAAGTDYTASFSYDAPAHTGTCAIAFGGFFSGSKTVSFDTRVPVSLEGATVTVERQYYTGTTIKPTPTVEVAGERLVADVDFTCTYASNVAVGTGRVTVTGTGATSGVQIYEGSKTCEFEIARRPLADDVTVTAPAQTYNFGRELRPTPDVRLSGRALVSGSDYTVVSYANNTAAGTATVTVRGTGNFTGEKSGTFQVAAKSLSAAQVTAAAQTYTGDALKPTPTVTLSGVRLAQGSDYIVSSYSGNVGAGTGRVTVAGTGNFQGQATGTFQIGSRDLSGASVTAADQTYSGRALTPGVAVTLGGRRLASGVDYTVSYASNVGPGTATVTVWGRGNYTGSARGSFRIADGGVLMYRLYNPYSGEHFYTASEHERNSLDSIGWNYEGVGWKAPTTGDPVYRLYNPYTSEHHYTLSRSERDALVALGWNYEGRAWNSGGPVALLRQFNPYVSIGSHNYTTSAAERDALVRVGWHDEGVGWYGLG